MLLKTKTYFPDPIWIFLVCLIALATRLILLFATNFSIDSDEAIVGLMAKHILEGREIPIFYYGQDYMGSLEAILTVPFFYFFSISNVCLKLVPVIFSLIHVYLVYLLATRFTDRFGARVASLLCAFPPSALVLWSTKARGGFIELVVLGTLALIISVDLLRASKPKKKNFFYLGLVLGLAWWVNNQIVFFIVPIFLVFLYHFYRTAGFRKLGSFLGTTTAAFILGSLPFWIYNLQEPYLRTFRFLLSSSSKSGFIEHFAGLFTKALPIIFGARKFWSEVDILKGQSATLYLIYGICLLVFLYRTLRSKEKASGLMLVLFVLSTFAIFSASSFGWLSLAPRYLLPLYAVIFVILGSAISKLGYFSYLFLVLLLASNFVSNYYPKLSIPGEPFIYSGERVSADQKELYSWLEKNNYSHIQANYWLGYRAAFETAEKVTFTRLGSPRSLRIEEYENPSIEKEKFPVYVTVPSEAAILERTLAASGYHFRTSEASGYKIIDDLSSIETNLEEINLSKDLLSATERVDLLENLIDDDLDTRWGSSKPQAPGMEIGLSFKEPREIAAVFIEMANFAHDGARELTIEGRDESGDWCILFDSYGTKMFYDARDGNYGALPTTWKIYFKPRALTELRLVQRGSDKIFDWSVADLKLFTKSVHESDN